MTQMERYTGKENQIITSNEKIILFHGSKSGIEGMIAPNSRDKCDFGKGFELALKTGYDCPAFIKSFMRSRTAAALDDVYDRVQWAGEEYILEELDDEVGGLRKSGVRYSKEVMYWTGYVYRYWHYYAFYRDCRWQVL